MRLEFHSPARLNCRAVIPILLATGNAHKTTEFARILGAEFTVRDLCSLPNFAEVEETGNTFAENAALKAVAASRRASSLVVGDDSGLEVDALDGAPGIYSARYAGSRAIDEENIAKLLDHLRNAERRTARFRCVLAVAREGEMLATLHGTVEGVITDAPRGGNGFGYDPVFVPSGFDQTFAELGAATKDAISHRADACAQLRRWLLAGQPSA